MKDVNQYQYLKYDYNRSFKNIQVCEVVCFYFLNNILCQNDSTSQRN